MRNRVLRTTGWVIGAGFGLVFTGWVADAHGDAAALWYGLAAVPLTAWAWADLLTVTTKKTEG